jgi:hypothetical protein
MPRFIIKVIAIPQGMPGSGNDGTGPELGPVKEY